MANDDMKNTLASICSSTEAILFSNKVEKPKRHIEKEEKDLDVFQLVDVIQKNISNTANNRKLLDVCRESKRSKIKENTGCKNKFLSGKLQELISNSLKKRKWKDCEVNQSEERDVYLYKNVSLDLRPDEFTNQKRPVIYPHSDANLTIEEIESRCNSVALPIEKIMNVEYPPHPKNVRYLETIVQNQRNNKVASGDVNSVKSKDDQIDVEKFSKEDNDHSKNRNQKRKRAPKKKKLKADTV